MKTIIAGINAKYIHTALAARGLAAYAAQRGIDGVRAMEFTINQHPDAILRALYAERADCYLFSCYIWNWELVCRLVRDLRTLCPRAAIYLGGPQVSFHVGELLRSLPGVDGILRGEGEEPLCRLLRALRSGGDLSAVPSLTFWREGEVCETPLCAPMEMRELPFCYPDLDGLRHQIVYYESSRGCPFQCTYCLSSLERRVRRKPLELVLPELGRFLAAGVRQVKFCDRTFNCDREHCMAIWRYLMERDNGFTNFHFEITAELLGEEELGLLGRARPGLFQFEIGVQSVNPDTLRAIRRGADLSHLREVMSRLRENGNIHLHLDLIAGLPLEDYQSFARSFDSVFAMGPDQLQLGFLKVLPGSRMERDAPRYGIVSRACPPYEVLFTDHLSADELFTLKGVEEMVESYYNSGAFAHTLRFLLEGRGAFDTFHALRRFLEEGGWTGESLSRTTLYDWLYAFGTRRCGAEGLLLGELILLDICLEGKPKKLPACLAGRDQTKWYRPIRTFYEEPHNRGRYLPDYEGEDPAVLRRITHLEVFSFDLLSPGRERTGCALLFDYRKPKARRAVKVPLE